MSNMHFWSAPIAASMLCFATLAGAHAASPLPPAASMPAPITIATNAAALEAIPAEPPAPIAVSVDGLQSAPMPDADAVVPVVVPDNAPKLAPRLYTNKTQYRGDGFDPGSTAQGVQDRVTPAAGMAVNFPLD